MMSQHTVVPRPGPDAGKQTRTRRSAAPQFALAVGLLLMAGCATSGQMNEVARQNAENIRNLQTNNQVIYEQFADLALSMQEQDRDRSIRMLVDALRDYTDRSSGMLLGDVLDTRVAEIRSWLAGMEASGTGETLAAVKERVAIEHPVAGDVAAGFVSRERVAEIVPIMFRMWRADLSPETRLAATEPLLTDFQLLKSWRANDLLVRQDIEKRLTEARTESQLAATHARAFEAFAESSGDSYKALMTVLQDPELQELLLDSKRQENEAREKERAAERERINRAVQAYREWVAKRGAGVAAAPVP